MPKHALLAGFALIAVPAVADAAAVSVEAVSLPSSPVSSGSAPVLIGVIPIRWSGPEPLNPILSNVEFDVNIDIGTERSGVALTAEPLSISNTYRFEWEPVDVVNAPGPGTVVADFEISGGGPFSVGGITTYFASFGIPVDSSFDFLSSTFYNLRVFAQGPTFREGEVTDFVNTVSANGFVRIFVPTIPAPPALALLGLSAFALGLLRRK